jgi:hypothetical protein
LRSTIALSNIYTIPVTPEVVEQPVAIDPNDVNVETIPVTPEVVEQPVAIDPNDVNKKTLSQLKILMEESLQIYELEDQKVTVIADLHNALKVITSFLGFSTLVHPGIFNLPSNSTVTMLPDLKLLIILANGKTVTKKFTDYTPEIITQIVEYIIPQLLKLIKSQKTYLTEKIIFLRTTTKQLSTLSQLNENVPTIQDSNEE